MISRGKGQKREGKSFGFRKRKGRGMFLCSFLSAVADCRWGISISIGASRNTFANMVSAYGGCLVGDDVPPRAFSPFPSKTSGIAIRGDAADSTASRYFFG